AKRGLNNTSPHGWIFVTRNHGQPRSSENDDVRWSSQFSSTHRLTLRLGRSIRSFPPLRRLNSTGSSSMASAPSLDQKLNRIRAGRYRHADFIIADAKDADMGFGLTAPGPNGNGGFKSRDQYLDAMAAMTRSGLVDIMLMSASSAEALVKRGLFKSGK